MSDDLTMILKARCREVLLTECWPGAISPITMKTLLGEHTMVDLDNAAAAMARSLAKVDAILGPANTLTTGEWEAVLAAARGED